MIVLANDDGKKMVERDDLGSFLDEYAYVTGIELTPVGAAERNTGLRTEAVRIEHYIQRGLRTVSSHFNPIRRRTVGFCVKSLNSTQT
jgi:hypothetical protein